MTETMYMLEIKYLLSSLCQKKFADLWLIASFLLSCYMDVETLDLGSFIEIELYMTKCIYFRCII